MHEAPFEMNCSQFYCVQATLIFDQTVPKTIMYTLPLKPLDTFGTEKKDLQITYRVYRK